MTMLSERTQAGYRAMLRRYEAAGSPDPEAWLDSLTLSNAHNGRNALRWRYPDLELRRRTFPEKTPRALSVEELEVVRSACDGLVLDVVNALYLTGARCSELLRIRPEHITDLHVLLQQTKGHGGRRERAVPRHPDFPAHIFPMEYGAHWVGKWLRLTGRECGVHLHPHLLRSTFATHLLDRGVPISVVQQLLGHGSITTTARYLAVSDAARRQAVALL